MTGFGVGLVWVWASSARSASHPRMAMGALVGRLGSFVTNRSLNRSSSLFWPVAPAPGQTSRPVQRRGPQVLSVQCRPQVDHVPVAVALRVEALVLVQLLVDAEGAAAAIAAVDGTGTAFLRPGALQPRRQAEVIEQALHR